VLGNVSDAQLEQLVQGVELEDGPARFEEIVDGGGEGANHWYYVLLAEGRNREVRRLWETIGVTVSRLIRVRFGPIFLEPRLKTGWWEDLNTEQMKELYTSVKLPVPSLPTIKPRKAQGKQSISRGKKKARRK
jgi:23S rRNA pseudouridine2605 synthase